MTFTFSLHFSIPCWTLPESKPWVNVTISSALTCRLQSTAGKITPILRLVAQLSQNFSNHQTAKLSSDPFSLLELVPLTISLSGYLWPSSSSLSPFPCLLLFQEITFLLTLLESGGHQVWGQWLSLPCRHSLTCPLPALLSALWFSFSF